MIKATIVTALTVIHFSFNWRVLKGSDNMTASSQNALRSLGDSVGSDNMAAHSSTYLDLNSGLHPRKNSLSQKRVDFNCLPAQAALFSEKQPF